MACRSPRNVYVLLILLYTYTHEQTFTLESSSKRRAEGRTQVVVIVPEGNPEKSRKNLGKSPGGSKRAGGGRGNKSSGSPRLS